MLAAKHPNLVSFDAEEVWRINRARLALALHKLPSEIDQMPLSDYSDLMAVYISDMEIAKLRLERK